MLAWRGIPDSLGIGRNDAGGAISIGDNEGDIRPSPVLLPAPFGPQTRLRSRWIDTGATARRPLQFDDDTPRAIIVSGGDLPGPWYEFSGVDPNTGYGRYAVTGNQATVDYGVPVVRATAITGKNLGFTFQGRPAYRIELVQPVLGNVADRFVHYEAEVLDEDDLQVGSFRILSHGSQAIVLSPESGAFPDQATQVRVRAKFFQVITNAQEGLGSTYLGGGGGLVPNANVRIGFAFHKDPADPMAERYPATPDTFTYDLANPSVQEFIRTRGLTFVQWDVTFNGQFQRTASDTPPAFGPTTPRPELHWLRLPFRF
jgi:hypothetical protein